MLRMKIDMHCHVKEGSVDSRVSVEEYITILKEKGFQGMVITDHNTYNGYRYWKEHIKGKRHTDFVVLKGIEYDTRDAGHILVIMPEGVKMKLLELRGMPAPAVSPRSALHKRISFNPNQLKSIPTTVVTISAIIIFSLTT